MSDDWQPVRAPYTLVEDLFIIEHICNSRSYHKVKGAAFWKSLSSRMQLKGYYRTYLSLKERYTKHIIPNIHCYNLQSAEVTNLLRPFGEQQKQHEKKDNKLKNLRREYSLEDDEKLIKWVLKEKGDLKGNKIWQQLEAKNVIRGRTWESLKNRFLRSTVKNLPLLLDPKDCEKVLQRINGNWEPVENPSVEAEYQPVAAKLKRSDGAKKLRAQDRSRSNRSSSSSSRKTRSRSSSCSSVSEKRDEDVPALKAGSRKAGRRKLFTLGSDLASQSPFPVTPARSNQPPPRKPPSSRSSAISDSTASEVFLDNDDRRTRGNPTSTSSAPVSDSSCAKGKVCNCTDFIEDEETGLSEEIPCASDCRLLSIPATPSLNAEVSDRLLGRMSNCPSDRNDCPDDGMVGRKNPEERVCEFTEIDEEEFIIDPSFDYIDDDGLFCVKDGVKLRVGPTSFPVFIPRD